MHTKTTDRGSGHEAESWRREQLVGSGFPLPLARSLAGDTRYDSHALIELTERGCAPELAVRILAPIDQPVAA